jgi:hypothetical protein
MGGQLFSPLMASYESPTVAVARVLGMISSNPDGCRLELTTMARRS